MVMILAGPIEVTILEYIQIQIHCVPETNIMLCRLHLKNS